MKSARPMGMRALLGLALAGFVSAAGAATDELKGSLKYEAGGHLFMFRLGYDARPIITAVDVTFVGKNKPVTIVPPQLRVQDFQPYSKVLRVRFDGASYPENLPAFEIDGNGGMAQLRIEGQRYAAPVFWEALPSPKR
jgi:hypothetical protein